MVAFYAENVSMFFIVILSKFDSHSLATDQPYKVQFERFTVCNVFLYIFVWLTRSLIPTLLSSKIYMLFAGWEVRIVKTVTEVL